MKFDNILIQNKARDKAWEAFIKRKDVKAFMEKNKDYKFPLDGSYELWCMAWEKAWDAGFRDGWESGMAVEREACARVVEEHAKNIHGYDKHEYAYAIRERGEEQTIKEGEDG